MASITGRNWRAPTGELVNAEAARERKTKTVGKPDAAKLLQATLDEEKMTDKLLNKLAGSGINSEATRAA